jgi:hypothetical protein
MHRFISISIPVLLFPVAATAQVGSTWNAPTEGITVNDNTWNLPSLGRAACGSADTITADLKLTNAQIPTTGSATLWAWWASSGTAACTTGTDTIPQTASAGLLGSTDAINIGDSFLLAQAALTIPDALTGTSSTAPSFTDAVVMARVATACDAVTATFAGVDKTVLRLCFGLDLNGDSKIDPGSVYTQPEPHGWVVFHVKTMPPPAPDVPVVTPMDNMLSVQLKVTSASDSMHSADDIVSYRVVARPLPDDSTIADQAVDQWEAGTFTEKVGDASNTSGFAAEIQVDGENGKTYQVAAYARDSVENEGPVSAVVAGTPQAECSFAECLPEDFIQPGYCGAASASGFAALLIFVGLLARRRVSGTERES